MATEKERKLSDAREAGRRAGKAGDAISKYTTYMGRGADADLKRAFTEGYMAGMNERLRK